MALEDTSILGIKINPLNFDQVLAKVASFLQDGRQHQIVTVNPEFVMAAQYDNDFKQILNDADLSVADGVGLVWASRLLGTSIKDRVTGTDLVDKLAKEGERQGWRFFFLGGQSGSGEAASKMLRVRYPNLQLAGFFEGDGSEAGDDNTLAAVKKAGEIDILLVAYGHPKQEKWIKRNLKKTGVKLAIGVGGAFNYLSGRSNRPPEWLRQIGLEWLYRLVKEPWRLKRQLVLPKFVWLVLKERFNR